MNRIFTLLIFCFGFNVALQAQCEIVNNSFEDWVDVTLDIDTSGTLEPETIFLPENYASAFRLFFATFGQLFGGVTDQNLAENYFGIQRSDDASDGNFSMQIGGNSVFSLADALTVFECDGNVPSRFAMDIRHEGDVEDTLTILLTLGDNPVIPQTQEDLDAAAGSAAANLTIAQDSGPWNTFELEITDNANGISADSVFIGFIVSSNDAQIAAGEESFFLIDNLRFLNESGVVFNELSEAVKVFPVPFDDHIFIENDNEALRADLYDQVGQKVKSFIVQPGVDDYNLDQLTNSGNYILELRSMDNTERNTYNIIKK